MARCAIIGVLIIVSLVLLWRAPLTSCGSFDESTRAVCSGSVFPQVGQRVCYRRTVDTDPCNVVNCSVSTIDISQGSINLLGDSYKMASPRFFREDGIYQNKRLCQYNVPSCPIGTIAHMQWLSDNFQLEPMQNFNENASFCLDYVRLFNLDITGRGVPLDFNNNVCGTRNDFSIRISGLSLRFEFRSDAGDRFRGFRIDVVCVPQESELVDRPETRRRRKRSSEMGGSERTLRTRRGAVTSRMSPMGCTEVVGSPQLLPIPQDPTIVPQTGDSFQVPLQATITYSNETLRVVQGNEVLREIREVQRLIFWTGFNGTRVFTGSALVPEDEIFGGGRLLIVKECVYYATFQSPPRLEPNSIELDILTLLTNATAPFFVGEDIDDFDERDDPPTPPPTTEAPPTRPPRHQRPHPSGDDPRVDPAALELAFEFENACNIYLRQAARSFLSILEAEKLIQPLPKI